MVIGHQIVNRSYYIRFVDFRSFDLVVVGRFRVKTIKTRNYQNFSKSFLPKIVHFVVELHSGFFKFKLHFG